MVYLLLNDSADLIMFFNINLIFTCLALNYIVLCIKISKNECISFIEFILMSEMK